MTPRLKFEYNDLCDFLIPPFQKVLIMNIDIFYPGCHHQKLLTSQIGLLALVEI
jgi:hypothetical protein